MVWVSSDYDAASQQAYMDAKHGDWLQVLWPSPRAMAVCAVTVCCKRRM